MNPRGGDPPQAVPQGAYAPEVIRGWDRRAIEAYGLPGVVLMENAGAAAARILVAEAERGLPPPYHIYCGPGNNGGDGLVVARHLHNHGYPVEVTLIGAGAGGAFYRSGSDAAIHYEVVLRMGLDLRTVCAAPALAGPDADVPRRGTIVDALFGTGLSRPLTPPYSDWLEALAASPCPVVALDIPSGLDARSGEILGVCLRATLTVTFAARKTGFLERSGPQVTGRVEVVNIGIPREIWQAS